MHRWTLAALVAIGCHAHEDEARPWPSPYAPSVSGEDAAASLTAEDAAVLVPEQLAALAALSPAALRDGHAALLARGDAGCPETYELVGDGETTLLWQDDCLAADGTRFRGEVLITTFAEGFAFVSEGPFSIETPDGRYLRGAAYIEAVRYVDDGTAVSSLYALGHLEADPVTAAGDGWLAGTMNGTLELYAEGDVGASGALAIAHPELSAIELRDLRVEPSGLTQGSLALRDRAGAWHQAHFADGCAELVFAATSLGSFCVPEPALAAWEIAP
jgi:hypothetical protein